MMGEALDTEFNGQERPRLSPVFTVTIFCAVYDPYLTETEAKVQ